MQKCTNHLENAFGRIGIQISKRSYNQLELFVNSFPGNCYSMNPDYDRFLTLSDAASCLMYKEKLPKSEDTPLKVYYTETEPLIGFYEQHGILKRANTQSTIEENTDAILRSLAK